MKLLKINFKKVAVIYIIAAVVAGIAGGVLLGVVFRDKISLYMDSREINGKLESSESFTPAGADLTSFVDKHSDVTGALITDGAGNILFRAGADMVAGNTFVPQGTVGKDRHKETGLLNDPNDPNVYFHVPEGRDEVTMFLRNEDENDWVNGRHFGTGVVSGKVYFLQYRVDRVTGNRVYLIYDVQPVINSGYAVKGVAALAMLFFMVYWVLIALYVYVDATRSKLRGAAWGILTLFTNLAGLLVYLIYRQSGSRCPACRVLQLRGNPYCTSCGEKLYAVCGHCGQRTGRRDIYCGACGQKIKEDGTE